MKYTNKKRYRKINKKKFTTRKRRYNKSLLLKKKNKKIKIKSYKKMRGGRGILGSGLLEHPLKLAANNMLDTFNMNNINPGPVGNVPSSYSESITP